MPVAALIALSPLVAVVVVVVTMTAAVVVTMVVENWNHLVERLPGSGRSAPQVITWSEAEANVEAYRSGIAPLPGPQVPPGGVPQGAVDVVDGALVIRDVPTARVLSALLFAGHATRRVSGSDRAAAWVTVAATPPGADPERLAPGMDLRGRPARVDELLDHDECGAAWITLQPSIDIARAVRKVPVRQAVLAALVSWWARSCDEPGELSPEEVVALRDALAVVRRRIDLTTWAEPVHTLHAAVARAAEAGSPLRVVVGGSPISHPAVAGGRVAAQDSGRVGSSGST